jgi:hypothetical protein
MTAWSIGAQRAKVMAGLAQRCIFPFNPQTVIENELQNVQDQKEAAPGKRRRHTDTIGYIKEINTRDAVAGMGERSD